MVLLRTIEQISQDSLSGVSLRRGEQGGNTIKRTIRSVCSTLGAVVILCAFAGALLGDTSAAPNSQESGAEYRKQRRKADKNVVRAHGFVRDDNVFTTIDAPRADAFTVAFGIGEAGRTVGGYVDRRGRLHGYLLDQGKFTAIDFPGAKATFAARINARGQIVGAYSKESNAPAFNLPHGFLLEDGVFTKIDFPDALRTQPFGINKHGQIVGEYVDAEGRSHGFLLENGVFTTIDALGGAATIARDINDNGQIVGVSYTARVGRGFLRDANGAFTTISVPNAVASQPYGINNRGQIVGFYDEGQQTGIHGFLLKAGVFSPIDFPDTTGNTVVFDINDEGQLAGAYDVASHGYLQDRHGNFTTIDHPDTVTSTGEPIGINNRSQIVGNYIDADGRDRSFLLDKHRFTTIDVPGALGSYAIKINDRGQIVGIYSTLSNLTIDPLHGYLLHNGVFTTIDFPGAVSTRASDINNRGQIVGEYLDAAGATHGFLRRSSGAFTTIDVPGATGTAISGINDRGRMIGVYGDAKGILHAFQLDNGVVTIIDFPNALVTIPFGINNRGQIVGLYFDDVRAHGFLLGNGVFTKTPDPPGAPEGSVAYDIDDQGRIVGFFF